MAELLESIDKAKAIAAELIELLHIPGDAGYEKCFHSHNYTLRYAYNGAKMQHPAFKLRLHKKPIGRGGPLHAGSGPTLPMMGFDKPAGEGPMTFAGHGDVGEVVTALEELRDQYNMLVVPTKQIIEILAPKQKHVGFVLAFDVGDAMVSLSKEDGKYTMTVYRGTISTHPSNVSIKITLDDDLNLVNPTQVKGPPEKVRRTMAAVLEDAQKGTFRLIKQEITDA